MHSPRFRLAACLLIAALLHVAIGSLVEVPDFRAPHLPAAIDVVVQGFVADNAPQRLTEDSPDEPSFPRDDAVLPDADLVPARNVAAADPSHPSRGADAEPPAAPPQAPQVPHRDVFAGTTTTDVARAITAMDAEREQNETSIRIRRVSATATGDPELAYYLESWRRKVERVGNTHYPAAARARSLSGTLRLLVAITPDGELQEVRLLASSGHPVLDDGAVRIVQLAAPFSPFTRTMRATTDLLEIERTWRFRNDRLTPAP